MSIDYLNLSRAKDLKNSKERIFYRFLEVLPGFLSFGTLGVVFLFSWLMPVVMAVFIIIFDLYWLLRIVFLSFHQISSFLQMKKNLKTNWLGKLSQLTINNKQLAIKNWQDVYHLIILPMYKEDIEIVRTTLQSLVDSECPKENFIVVLATEERAGEGVQEAVKKLGKEFSEIFFKFLITCHPKDIPGEIAGKGSNVAWAQKKFKEEILNKLSIPSENIIVSNFDIDTKPYPQYFSCLTYHYLTAKNPLKSSYQPIPVYNNNIWEAPAFSRVIATSGTFWQMMQQERPEQLVSYSSHSIPFKVLADVGYPLNMTSDDSRIFWKAYLFYNGDYKVVPLYYPFSMDAVLAENFSKTVVNQYKQQRRWAWGCENIPYIFFNFLQNKKIPLIEKIRHSFVILDGFWSWAVATLIIFLLGWLPLMIGGEHFKTSLLSYNLPRLTSLIMTAAMVGIVISAITSLLLLPPRPKGLSRWKNISMFFQWLLMPVTLIVFGAFPALESQTRLALKKYLGFWVTEKIRK